MTSSMGTLFFHLSEAKLLFIGSELRQCNSVTVQQGVEYVQIISNSANKVGGPIQIEFRSQNMIGFKSQKFISRNIYIINAPEN